jgi:hypothetical protein
VVPKKTEVVLQLAVESTTNEAAVLPSSLERMALMIPPLLLVVRGLRGHVSHFYLMVSRWFLNAMA